MRIAAKVDPADQNYFEAEIEPLLNHPLIEFVGEISDAEKDDFLGNAMALVCQRLGAKGKAFEATQSPQTSVTTTALVR